MPERLFEPSKVIRRSSALCLICLVVIGISCRWVAARPFAYISDAQTSTVTVIDTSTNTVVTTIPVGNYPIGVTVHPNGTRVYVANLNSNTVSVIDTFTNTVIDTVSVGLNPSGLAVHPAGTWVYVTNSDQGGSGSVSVIDTSINTVIATVAVGFAPHGVAVHPDGTRVYIADESNVVSVINTANNTVSARISVGGAPTGVAVHPHGTRVYVASTTLSAPAGFGGQTFSVVDTIKAETDPAHAEINRPTVEIGAARSAGYGVAVTPDGTRLYYAGNPLSVVDTATNTLLTTVFAGFGPQVFGQFIRPAILTFPLYCSW